MPTIRGATLKEVKGKEKLRLKSVVSYTTLWQKFGFMYKGKKYVAKKGRDDKGQEVIRVRNKKTGDVYYGKIIVGDKIVSLGGRPEMFYYLYKKVK